MKSFWNLLTFILIGWSFWKLVLQCSRKTPTRGEHPQHWCLQLRHPIPPPKTHSQLDRNQSLSLSKKYDDLLPKQGFPIAIIPISSFWKGHGSSHTCKDWTGSWKVSYKSHTSLLHTYNNFQLLVLTQPWLRMLLTWLPLWWLLPRRTLSQCRKCWTSNRP